MESNDTSVLTDELRKKEIKELYNGRDIIKVNLTQLARYRFSDYVNKYGIAIKPIIFRDTDISSVSDAIDSEIMYTVIHNVCLTQVNIPDMSFSTYILDIINERFNLNLIPDSDDCKLMLDYINDLVNEYNNIDIPEYDNFIYLVTSFDDCYGDLVLFILGK